MNRQQAQDFIADVLATSHPGELQVALSGTYKLGTRFNDCAVSQNILKQQTTLTLTARLEQKKASITLNSLDDNASIESAIKQVFATCRHMPDDEEVMPAMGEVLASKEYAYSAAAESLEIETIGAWAASACKEGAAAGIDLAGLLSLGKNFYGYGDSAGGFAFERYHRTDYHVTATGNNGSGWAEDQGVTIQEDDVATATRRAIDKCLLAQNPAVYEPRPCTVILEPQAVGDLLMMAFWYGFDQRSKDEGRSAFSNYAENLGKLSFYSDPANEIFPTISFTADGQALDKTLWLDEGKLQQLLTNRYWAANNALEVKPSPNNIILAGEGASLDELVQSTDDGILVTLLVHPVHRCENTRLYRHDS